jgi:deoxyribodipyrimidine photo-lyase
MGRDQRIDDNWAFIAAYNAAKERSEELLVVFNLPSSYGQGTLRHFDFLLQGMTQVEERCVALNVRFFILEGEVVKNITYFIKNNSVGELFADFNPLRLTRAWHDEVYASVAIMATEVDAHNIVPCFAASPKEEFAAYTFRPKVTKLLSTYLTQFPKLTPLPSSKTPHQAVDFKGLYARLQVDTNVPPVDWLEPGAEGAHKVLDEFVQGRLDSYATGRNDPNQSAVSNLSPYLHFGQISAQRVALTVQQSELSSESKAAFLEELIVRKELADNYCFYNENYDQVAGAHAWAQKTIVEHKKDKREFIYTREQFEAGKTHDELWNAMQLQMVLEGKMHGWCRMYWAKKILEWTPDVQTAIDTALYLNDRYELDGNDPNGFVGVMWSIAGVHDRAWTERPIFGKVRYMNFNGAKRKFDVPAFIKKYDQSKTLFPE